MNTCCFAVVQVGGADGEPVSWFGWKPMKEHPLTPWGNLESLINLTCMFFVENQCTREETCMLRENMLEVKQQLADANQQDTKGCPGC